MRMEDKRRQMEEWRRKVKTKDRKRVEYKRGQEDESWSGGQEDGSAG